MDDLAAQLANNATKLKAPRTRVEVASQADSLNTSAVNLEPMQSPRAGNKMTTSQQLQE